MKPSILFIFTDQMRRDCLSCADHPDVKTPHLDALASDGVRFNNTVTQAPLCVPARMSLFTGRYVHQHGCTNNPITLWPDTENFVRSIRDCDYETVSRGKLHLYWKHDIELLMAHPLHREFGFTDPMETTGKCSAGRLRASAYTEYLKDKGELDRFWRDLIERVKARTLGVTFGPSVLSEEDQMDGWIMDQGLAYLREHRQAQKPWLLWVGPEGPHDPFDPPGKWATMYNPQELDVGLRQFSEDPQLQEKAEGMAVKDASDEDIQIMRANYYGNISFIDHKVGQLINELKETNRYDDTWIIFSSDHGEMLGDFHLTAKLNFHWQAINVPLIIKPPASMTDCPRGQVSQALVELIDLGTTMRDIAGGELTGDEGQSLMPILSGESDLHLHRESAHSQVHDTYMIQTTTRKLVFKNPDNPEAISFFDLENDLEELHNLREDRADEVAQFIKDHVRPFFKRTRENMLPAPKHPSDPWPGRDHSYPYFEFLPASN